MTPRHATISRRAFRRLAGPVAILAGLVWLSGCQPKQSAAPAASARVCYHPFGWETFAGIDRKHFASHCMDLGAMSTTEGPIAALLAEIRRGTPIDEFSEGVVRLSVRMPDGTLIYVNKDNEAVAGGRVVRLPSEFVHRLDGSLSRTVIRIYGRDS